MAVGAGRVALAIGTAAPLFTADDDASMVTVRNTSGTQTVQLGGPDVTTTNGFDLGPGTSITVQLQGGEVLFAVTGVATTVHVLRTGLGRL